MALFAVLDHPDNNVEVLRSDGSHVEVYGVVC
jgi:hypothetical protein